MIRRKNIESGTRNTENDKRNDNPRSMLGRPWRGGHRMSRKINHLFGARNSIFKKISKQI